MLIDVQNAFLDSKWGKRNNPNAEQKMLRLLQHFRAKRQKRSEEHTSELQSQR